MKNTSKRSHHFSPSQSALHTSPWTRSMSLRISFLFNSVPLFFFFFLFHDIIPGSFLLLVARRMSSSPFQGLYFFFSPKVFFSSVWRWWLRDVHPARARSRLREEEKKVLWSGAWSVWCLLLLSGLWALKEVLTGEEGLGAYAEKCDVADAYGRTNLLSTTATHFSSCVKRGKKIRSCVTR